jgi:DNA-binding response OmpR family regulator
VYVCEHEIETIRKEANVSTLAAPPPERLLFGDKRPSIILVQDIPVTTDLLAESLEFDRFAVTHVPTAEEAQRAMLEQSPDIAVIDMALSGMTGLDLIQGIRESGRDASWDAQLPVMALCRSEDDQMPIRAIERGADDAMRDPFHYPELVARLSALLTRGRGTSPSFLRAGPLEIDRLGFRARLNGRPIPLSAKEFGLLVALARDPRRVITKDELLRHVWGYRSAVRTRTVDTHASRLRRKLSEIDPTARMVTNVWGIGYRLFSLDD